MKPWNEDEDKELGKGATLEFKLLLGAVLGSAAIAIIVMIFA